MTQLFAPFPYAGGKRRIAADLWERLGDPTVYIEPFAGSIACLLLRPGGAGDREIVCDKDGQIANFWRAVQHDPEKTAYYADNPTIHQDLIARHRYLRQWVTEHAEKLTQDPRFYDAEAAGWWVWGMSHWIGGPFGAPLNETNTPDGIPKVHAKDAGGEGVSQQRANIPVIDPRPTVDATNTSGRGVSHQRTNIPCHDKRPTVDATNTSGRGVSHQRENIPIRDLRPVVMNSNTSGMGVSVQRKDIPVTDGIPAVIGGGAWGAGVSYQRATRPELISWFHALQTRLQRVIVLNRDWTSALTKPMLMGHRPNTQVGILLDPPYRLGERSTIYAHEDGDCPAEDSWQWALEHGNRYRIAYCCHAGDFDVPDEWETLERTFPGVSKKERKDRRDQINFSPACRRPQSTLF